MNRSTLFVLLVLNLILAMTGASWAAKDRTTLSKAYARDSSTTITKFTVERIALNGDSTLTVFMNGGDLAVTIYADSLPVRVRQGLQRINADVKAALEK